MRIFCKKMNLFAIGSVTPIYGGNYLNAKLESYSDKIDKIRFLRQKTTQKRLCLFSNNRSQFYV